MDGPPRKTGSWCPETGARLLGFKSKVSVLGNWADGDFVAHKYETLDSLSESWCPSLKLGITTELAGGVGERLLSTENRA